MIELKNFTPNEDPGIEVEYFLAHEISEMFPQFPRVLDIKWYSKRINKISAKFTVLIDGKKKNVFVKYARPANFFRFFIDAFVGAGYLKYIQTIKKLEACNIPIPKTLFAVEDRFLIFPKRTLVVSEFLDDYKTFKEYSMEFFPKNNPNLHNNQMKRKLLFELATLLKKIHKNNIFHLDLHWENIMIKEENQEIKLCLIDLDKTRYYNLLYFSKSISYIIRIYQEIKYLYKYLSRLYSEDDLNYFMEKYFEDFITNPRKRDIIENKIIQDSICSKTSLEESG